MALKAMISRQYTWPSNTCEVERTMTMKLYNTDLNALGIQPKTMR